MKKVKQDWGNCVLCFRLQRNLLKKSTFSQKIIVTLNSFSDILPQSFGSFPKKRQGCQNCRQGLRVLKNFLKPSTFFEKTCNFLLNFGLGAKDNQTFGEEFLSRMSNSLSTCPEKNVEISFFQKRSLFIEDFWTLSGWSSASFWRKSSIRLVKTAFYMSSGKFWLIPFFWKNIFFWIFSIFDWRFWKLLSKIFQQCCQNQILRVQRNFVRKFLLKIRFSFFKSWSKSY